MDIRGPADGVAETAHQLSQLILDATQAAVMATKSRNRVDGILVVATGCVAALHVLASILGWHGDADNRECTPADMAKLVNPTSTLLASLLCHTMSPEATIDARGITSNIEFGPQAMWDAIQSVERLTGRRVDGYIDPGMLKSLRAIVSDTNEPLNRFLAQHRQTPGTIN